MQTPRRPPAEAGPDAFPTTFSVLAVCTGNICRSPAVERLLGALFEGQEGLVVASAGTYALVGEGISGPMARLIAERGADPHGFSARLLTESMVARADLVLGLTREHRSAVVSMHPQALRRTFTLRELARLATDVEAETLDAAAHGATPADRLAALVPLALARRGQQRVGPGDDDVVDPYRRSQAVYRESLGQITDALEAVHGAITR